MFRWKPRFECPLLGIFWVQLRQGRIWQRSQIATFPQCHLRFVQLSRKTEIATGKTDPSDLVWSKSYRGEKKKEKKKTKKKTKSHYNLQFLWKELISVISADFAFNYYPEVHKGSIYLCVHREKSQSSTQPWEVLKQPATYLDGAIGYWSLFFVFDEYGR